MKKILLALCLLFITLTFIGAVYVLINKGHVNAGYAVIPMGFSLMLLFAYRRR